MRDFVASTEVLKVKMHDDVLSVPGQGAVCKEQRRVEDRRHVLQGRDQGRRLGALQAKGEGREQIDRSVHTQDSAPSEHKQNELRAEADDDALWELPNLSGTSGKANTKRKPMRKNPNFSLVEDQKCAKEEGFEVKQPGQIEVQSMSEMLEDGFVADAQEENKRGWGEDIAGQNFEPEQGTHDLHMVARCACFITVVCFSASIYPLLPSTSHCLQVRAYGSREALQRNGIVGQTWKAKQ